MKMSFKLWVCSLDNHLDLQHFLLSSEECLLSSFPPGLMYQRSHNLLWIWKCSLAGRQTTIHLQLSPTRFQLQWQSSPSSLSSENSRNSVLIATEILEWKAWMNLLLSLHSVSLSDRHNVNLDIILGETFAVQVYNAFISTTIFPDVWIFFLYWHTYTIWTLYFLYRHFRTPYFLSLQAH